MMLWLVGGAPSTPVVGTPADNAPSLWSGGVRWGDDAAPFGDGTDAYWSSPVVATGRTGFPRLAVALGGGLVLEQLQAANWSLGRRDWLSTLTPTSASFTFVDKPAAAINDSVVVALMSDEAEYHSESLWVGRVASMSTRRDVDGHVFTTITATDVVGVLGQADMPASIAAGHTLVSLVERLAADAGVPLQVDTDSLATLPTLTAATGLEGKTIDLINRAERSSNALLFLRGNGRLYAAVRDTTGASSVPVVELDGDDSPSSWVEETSLDSVVTRWNLGGELWESDTEATTLDEYGDHTYSATDLLINDPAPYASLIASDVMAHPRAVVVEAPFPIRNLGQKVLYLDPLDRVSIDGTTCQVMSVDHSVTPIRLDDGQTQTEWCMTITADATQEALVGAAEPGPVTPPALNTVTQTYISTKAATAELTAGGSGTGTGSGELKVGKYPNGSRYRSSIGWTVVPPANVIRVVAASVRLVTYDTMDDPRIDIQGHIESWTEGGMTWGGPKSTAKGRRTVDIPRATDKATTVSITAIIEAQRAAGEFYGIALRSVNEDNSERRAAFYSDDAADPAANAPRLTITWEVIS